MSVTSYDPFLIVRSAYEVSTLVAPRGVEHVIAYRKYDNSNHVRVVFVDHMLRNASYAELDLSLWYCDPLVCLDQRTMKEAMKAVIAPYGHPCQAPQKAGSGIYPLSFTNGVALDAPEYAQPVAVAVYQQLKERQ